MYSRVAATSTLIAIVWLTVGARPSARPESESYVPLLKSLEPAAMCLTDQAGVTAAPDGAATPQDWPGPDTIGGNIAPLRLVYDPHPTFDGVAVDPENDIVAMTDENRHAVLTYGRADGGDSAATTPPRRHIFGPRTELGYMASLALDPAHREIFALSNDGGGLTVYPYDAHGNVRPLRSLTVPHQSWGISLGLTRGEMAITSQQNHAVYIYPRTAAGADAPLRSIRGSNTKLADPHGVILDETNREIVVANHGNWTELRSYAADGPLVMDRAYVAGKHYPPSIAVFSSDANGNLAPLRVIEGPSTGLNWPMGLALDPEANEWLVANYGTSSILMFKRSASGDAAPTRVLQGTRTGIVGPVGVAVDRKNRELWVANYGDHTALVFDLNAAGNVAPKRVIRNAPKGTPTTGFTNASAGAYDSKRGQVLVPN